MRVPAVLILALVAVTIVACGGSGRGGVAAIHEASIGVVHPDSRAVAATRVTGASSTERRAIDEFLPLLGPERPIRAITLGTDDRVTPHPRRLQIALADDSVHAEWLASLFGEAVQGRLAQHGEHVEWLGNRGSSAVTSQPEPDIERLRTRAQSALEHAAAAGFDASARIYPIGGVWITIRLNERGLLAPRRTDWLTALHFNDRTSPPLGIDVIAPDGTSLFTAGNGVCYGCSSEHVGATPGTPLPRSLSGPTRLKITVNVGGGEQRPNQTVTLNCTPDTAPSRKRACTTIIDDRYALFPPMPSDTMCAGGSGFASASISGLLGGIPIHLDYGNCTSVGARWIHDLTAAGVLAPTPS